LLWGSGLLQLRIVKVRADFQLDVSRRVGAEVLDHRVDHQRHARSPRFVRRGDVDHRQVLACFAHAAHQVDLGRRLLDLPQQLARFGRTVPLARAEVGHDVDPAILVAGQGDQLLQQPQRRRGPHGQFRDGPRVALALQRHVELGIDDPGVEIQDLIEVDALFQFRGGSRGP